MASPQADLAPIDSPDVEHVDISIGLLCSSMEMLGNNPVDRTFTGTMGWMEDLEGPHRMELWCNCTVVQNTIGSEQ